ncbi:hypothetical protein ACIBO1_07660 [Micromonospora sp. NPDC049903]|uniref:hypothetical protein n=1 Tax=Micromonospora sp. NPDC049903 TaxID=3364276 RepID=UPI0037AF97F0
MSARWLPAIAITGSRLLRTELRTVEQQAGYEFEYADSIPAGRRNARLRPLIIIGTDLLARVRKPMICRGLVVVASVNPSTSRVWSHGTRAGATYVIVLPTAGSWLAHHLVRDLPPPNGPTRPPHQPPPTD